MLAEYGNSISSYPFERRYYILRLNLQKKISFVIPKKYEYVCADEEIFKKLLNEKYPYESMTCKDFV